MPTLFAPHVVLGAGAMGAATAYHLARRGEPVLLVEQFALGHDRGSSHGAARITRHSYPDPLYARLMLDAFRAWCELEADAGRPLFIRTGGLSFGPAGSDYVARVAANLAALDVPYRLGQGRDLAGRLPAFALPPDADYVFEPDAGLIAAERAVAAQIELARHHGGDRTTILEGRPIRRIDLDADRPTLVADDLRIVADRLVIAAGAWAGRLVPALVGSLTPTRQQVCYFRPAEAAPFAIGRFPIFIYLDAAGNDAFYGMPDFLGAGVKVARHAGPECDPDRVDRTIHADLVADVRGFVGRFLPGLAEAPLAKVETCLYTLAPNDDFVVGPLLDRPDVIVASPCSGHGFKFSCFIGKLLADYALKGTTAYDVAAWRPERLLGGTSPAVAWSSRR